MVRIVDIDCSDSLVSDLIAQLGTEPIRLVRGNETLATLSPPTATPAPQAASFAEGLQQSGMLGCVEDAPADLSSNPKYLDDLGEE